MLVVCFFFKRCFSAAVSSLSGDFKSSRVSVLNAVFMCFVPWLFRILSRHVVVNSKESQSATTGNKQPRALPPSGQKNKPPIRPQVPIVTSTAPRIPNSNYVDATGAPAHIPQEKEKPSRERDRRKPLECS